MTYTHMPYFMQNGTGVFCVSDSVKQYDGVSYRPWSPVYGTLEQYTPVDFPKKPNSPFFIPCSPVIYNNMISISYGSKVYSKIFNSSDNWSVVQEKVWSGYSDGTFVHYVRGNVCHLSGSDIDLPFFVKAYKLTPCGFGHIITGKKINGENASYIIDNNLNFNLLTTQGENVYKCSIANNTLYHSVKQDNDGIENYLITTTSNFEIERV